MHCAIVSSRVPLPMSLVSSLEFTSAAGAVRRRARLGWWPLDRGREHSPAAAHRPLELAKHDRGTARAVRRLLRLGARPWAARRRPWAVRRLLRPKRAEHDQGLGLRAGTIAGEREHGHLALRWSACAPVRIRRRAGRRMRVAPHDHASARDGPSPRAVARNVAPGPGAPGAPVGDSFDERRGRAVACWS